LHETRADRIERPSPALDLGAVTVDDREPKASMLSAIRS
jgi:hypothetical protein